MKRLLATGAMVAVLSLASAACSQRTASTDETNAPLQTAYGVSDVWLQFGDYVLGAQPDMYVTGPEIVIYKDGTVFAQVRASVIDGRVPYKMKKGRLTAGEMRQLAAQVQALPSPAPISDVPADALSAPLTFGGRTWDVPTWDDDSSATPPVTAFIESLRDMVRSQATAKWFPDLWIVRPYGAGPDECIVAAQPVNPLDYYEAAVYPHMTQRYTLGMFDCYG